jgi:hypothetical protein
MYQKVISHVLGVVGAVLGGTVGFYTFGWLFEQHYYGPMIPGAFLGLGCGMFARHHSMIRGVLCGVAALGLSLFTEYTYWPFIADHSFQYFVTHIPSLEPTHLIMIVAGSLIAFWVGKDAGMAWFGRRRRAE